MVIVIMFVHKNTFILSIKFLLNMFYYYIPNFSFNVNFPFTNLHGRLIKNIRFIHYVSVCMHDITDL